MHVLYRAEATSSQCTSDASETCGPWQTSKLCVCRQFQFEVKDHVQLGATLGVVDFEAGAAVAGTKFAYLRGAGALLEVAASSASTCTCPAMHCL